MLVEAFSPSTVSASVSSFSLISATSSSSSAAAALSLWGEGMQAVRWRGKQQQGFQPVPWLVCALGC